MTGDDFAALIQRGYEMRGIEFKEPGLRKKDLLFAKIVKAVLGMANTRDGGLVILGVQDKPDGLSPVGLSPDQLKTWQSRDEVAASINVYASPSVEIDLEIQ